MLSMEKEESSCWGLNQRLRQTSKPANKLSREKYAHLGYLSVACTTYSTHGIMVVTRIEYSTTRCIMVDYTDSIAQDWSQHPLEPS